MKKRRHHYVWQHYLAAWATSEFIWCRRNTVVFRTNLKNVAVTKDFYRLRDLTIPEIEFIYKLAIERSQKHLQDFNKGWISFFTKVFRVKEFCKNNEISDFNMHEKIDEIIQNCEEDLHMHIEDDAIKYLDSLRKEDTTFYDTNRGCIDFAHFIAVQYLRTEPVRATHL